MGKLEAIRSRSGTCSGRTRCQSNELIWPGVIGHREITDAYLIALARHNDARLVTLDRGRAALHPKQVRLLG